MSMTRPRKTAQGGGLVFDWAGRALEEGPDMEDSFYQKARSLWQLRVTLPLISKY